MGFKQISIMRKGKVVVLGSLAGLAIGSLAGILFAPEKGSKFRSQIKDKSNQYTNELKSQLDKLRYSLARNHDSTQKDAENLAAKGKAKYDEARKDVKNAASDLKHSVS